MASRTRIIRRCAESGPNDRSRLIDARSMIVFRRVFSHTPLFAFFQFIAFHLVARRDGGPDGSLEPSLDQRRLAQRRDNYSNNRRAIVTFDGCIVYYETLIDLARRLSPAETIICSRERAPRRSNNNLSTLMETSARARAQHGRRVRLLNSERRCFRGNQAGSRARGYDRTRDS